MSAETTTRLLVTGGCGYLGSRLIRDLATDEELGRPAVRILDNFQSGQHSALLDLPPAGDFEHVEGDLLDPSLLRRALSGVQRVVHLAAIERTPFSFESPAWLEQVNHWGTVHLIDACIEAGVEHLVYVGTCAVYGPGGPFDETSPCRPMGAYAQSKLRAEEAVAAAGERGLASTVARLAILYGAAPVMRFDSVANRLAYLAGVGRALTIYGSGDQRRPLIHVEDASAALRWLLRHPPDPVDPRINVVSDNPSVLEIAAAVQAIRPETELRFTDQDVRTHLSLVARGDRLAASGWRPRLSLDAGLAGILERFMALRWAAPALELDEL